MAITPEVATALEELREAYPEANITAVEDGSGGSYVTVDPVRIGPKYVPEATWFKFQITFQYPLADVYPHFIAPEVRRADGQTPDNLPLGTGSSPGVFAVNGQSAPAMQLSRRSNHLNPAVDTAALKLAKVVAWLESL